MPSPTTRRLTRSQAFASAKQTRSNYRSTICDECGEVVGNQQEVEEHRQQIHGTGKYRCEEAFCSIGFKTVSLLRRHRLLKHQGRSSLGTPTKGKPTKVNGSKAVPPHRMNTSSSLPGAPVIPLAKSSSSTVESTKAMSPDSADPPPTPTTPTITLSRIPKLCRIVPNTGPSLRFSGAIRKPTEDPSVRVMRPRGGVALPRYCPRCGIFLLLTGREFREHEQEHEINGLRSAIQLTWLEVSKKKSMAEPSEGGQGQGQVPHATTTSSNNISPVNLTSKRQQVITKLTQSATVEVSASNGQGHLLQDSSKSSSSSLKINVAPAAESPSSAVISGSQPIRRPTPISVPPEVITIDDDDESGQLVATINNKRRRLLVASEAGQKVTNQHKKRRCTVCNLETVCKKKMQHHIWWSHPGFSYAQIVIRVDVSQEVDQEKPKSKPTTSTTPAASSSPTETEVIELD